MTESAIITALITAVAGGAGAVWIFLQNELKKRDSDIDKLNLKVEQMNALIIDLTGKYNKLEGKSEAEDGFQVSLLDIKSKVNQILEIDQRMAKKTRKASKPKATADK